MKNDIRTHLNEPTQLEKLYRANKVAFKQDFDQLYPELKGNTLADFWQARLHYETDEINWGTNRELVVLMLLSLVAGMLAKLPAFVSIDQTFFYSRNVGFIVFPALMVYFAWKNSLPMRKTGVLAVLTLIGLVFINTFPDVKKSDTLMLSCLHILLYLWSILGLAFVGDWRNANEKRLRYLKYNGDLIVMTALILMAGGIMTGITIGLFELIGLSIQKFYFENVVVFGLPIAPILGTYLTQTNPQLVGKVSPVIAKLFSPLVLVMLVIYLAAIINSGKNPYNDREFLLIFNGLLLGVMAIIFFSIAESSTKSRPEVWILLLLSMVTIVVNGIALSAILFRISAWGITANRAAVLGGNVLILINLVLVSAQLFRVLSTKKSLADVGVSIASYLPLYCIWAGVVTFIFPLLFGYK
ncbi:hypothetical protein [Spirosoma aerolatum]|uniref:hypothetical protein n=1 Tax=Spirosoma aerolatum TaxID=1211326 RepID=UPI0009AC8B04|nr:hypothetical protein [Spirosoma aerolatum]